MANRDNRKSPFITGGLHGQPKIEQLTDDEARNRLGAHAVRRKKLARRDVK